MNTITIAAHDFTDVESATVGQTVAITRVHATRTNGTIAESWTAKPAIGPADTTSRSYGFESTYQAWGHGIVRAIETETWIDEEHVDEHGRMLGLDDIRRIERTAVTSITVELID